MGIVVDFYGDLACFTNPALKVDRVSYDVPTPSAVRGMLASIYSKPVEFYWAVRKIEVMKPIRHMSVKTNELTCRMNALSPKAIDAVDYRTQRNTVYLKDVRYRVTAEIIPRKGFENRIAALLSQAERRISKGQCFRQPSLGLSGCTCYFEPADMSIEPISVTRNFGIMLFDTYVPYGDRVGVDGFSASFYNCEMKDGVICVPYYDDTSVLKLQQFTGGDSYVQSVV